MASLHQNVVTTCHGPSISQNHIPSMPVAKLAVSVRAEQSELIEYVLYFYES
jgi:hypothetical protein